jgi:hypothetical protein
MVARVVKVWLSVALVSIAATMYARYHLENFKRHEWGQSVYIEDHANGEFHSLFTQSACGVSLVHILFCVMS